jgi:hypothetical protein
MKCTICGHEAPVGKFRYLYNARIDGSLSLRQCPSCQEWLAVDELAAEAKHKVTPGDAPWGKSAGIEDRAKDEISEVHPKRS